jgi:hypothetical protein
MARSWQRSDKSRRTGTSRRSSTRCFAGTSRTSACVATSTCAKRPGTSGTPSRRPGTRSGTRARGREAAGTGRVDGSAGTPRRGGDPHGRARRGHPGKRPRRSRQPLVKSIGHSGPRQRLGSRGRPPRSAGRDDTVEVSGAVGTMPGDATSGLRGRDQRLAELTDVPGARSSASRRDLWQLASGQYRLRRGASTSPGADQDRQPTDPQGLWPNAGPPTDR